MKHIAGTIILLFFTSLGVSSTTVLKYTCFLKLDLTNSTNDSVVTLGGKIVREQFVNKKGSKVEGKYDYFLITDKEKIFIKLIDSEFKENDLKFYLDKKSVYKVLIQNGRWDVSKKDGRMLESRTGKYIVLKDMKTNCK